MTYAYFYLVGQNIAYLSTTWKVTLPLICLIGLIAAVASGFTDPSICGLVWGWLSVAYIVENNVQVDTTLYHFNRNPAMHFQGLVLAIEIILFTMMSLALLVDDGSVWIWMLIIFAHLIYVMLLFAVNKASKKIEKHVDALRYYFIYFMVLGFTDCFFIVLSMIVHDRRQNLIGIVIATLLSQAAIYVLRNYDVNKFFIPLRSDPELAESSPSLMVTSSSVELS